MKIAYIVEPRKVIGGGVRAAINLVKALNLYHNEKSLIWGVYKDTIKDSDVELREIATLNPISISYFKELHRFVKSYKPEIVHCLGLYTALVCIIYRKLYKVDFKIVLTVHRVTMNMRHKRLIKFVVNLIKKECAHVTFLTGVQQNHYFEKVKFCPESYSIIPNVIFVEDVEEKNRQQKHKELTNELKSDILLSYVGRIIPSKNIGDFIRIIAKLNKRGYNVGGVLVGGYDDYYYQELQTIIEEEKISEKILFVGYVNNPTLYTASCDFTLMPTKHGEALPNLLVESYALGKITFSSDIPQMVDLIDNGQNSFTHSLANLDDFVQMIVDVLDNQEMKLVIEKNARNTYNSTYNPQVVLEKYYSIYKSI